MKWKSILFYRTSGNDNLYNFQFEYESEKNISRFESRRPSISIKKNVISHEKYQNQPFLSSRQCSKDSYIKNVSYQNLKPQNIVGILR